MSNGGIRRSRTKAPEMRSFCLTSSDTLYRVWKGRGYSLASPLSLGGGACLVQVCLGHHQIFTGVFSKVSHCAGQRHTGENQTDVVPMFMSRLSVCIILEWVCVCVCTCTCACTYARGRGWTDCFVKHLLSGICHSSDQLALYYHQMDHSGTWSF